MNSYTSISIWIYINGIFAQREPKAAQIIIYASSKYSLGIHRLHPWGSAIKDVDGTFVILFIRGSNYQICEETKRSLKELQFY